MQFDDFPEVILYFRVFIVYFGFSRSECLGGEGEKKHRRAKLNFNSNTTNIINKWPI